VQMNREFAAGDPGCRGDGGLAGDFCPRAADVFLSCIVSPAIGVPSVVLTVPLIEKGLLTAARDGALIVRVVCLLTRPLKSHCLRSLHHLATSVWPTSHQRCQ
jgi:hypothetical protein